MFSFVYGDLPHGTSLDGSNICSRLPNVRLLGKVVISCEPGLQYAKTIKDLLYLLRLSFR